MLRVTFDTNVWTRIAVLETNRPEYRKLRNAIEAQRIEPYFCEIALDLETITGKVRLAFQGKLKSSMQVTGSQHPGFHPQYEFRVNEAKKLGFKALRMTNFVTIRCPDIPTTALTEIEEDTFWDYCNQLGKCSDYIVNRGWGRAIYDRFKLEHNLMCLSAMTHVLKIPPQKARKLCDAIREWVDGDSLAAHFAYGNHYFCTEDKATKAGTNSVFHSKNLFELEKEFSLNVVSMSELLEVL